MVRGGGRNRREGEREREREREMKHMIEYTDIFLTCGV